MNLNGVQDLQQVVNSIGWKYIHNIVKINLYVSRKIATEIEQNYIRLQVRRFLFVKKKTKTSSKNKKTTHIRIF